MGWYKTGTVSVTNGSATVTGSGTDFVANVKPGEEFRLQGGSIGYEVASVVSATELTLAEGYLGSAGSAEAYVIVPVRGFYREALDALSDAVNQWSGYVSGVLAGKFGAGTVAAPAIARDTDVNTGLYWPAADEVALAAGGAQRLVAKDTGVEVTGLLSGTAVQSTPTDTTVGRLMPVGAFGLGAEMPQFVGDVDDQTLRTGFYFVGAAATGTKPAGTAFGHMMVGHAAAGDRVHQTWVRESANGFRRWERYAVNGVWSAWAEVFHAGSVVGTVSEAGGVPTGAVIERGENANGNYTRFADGTQICEALILSSDTADTTWTFPAAFSAPPSVNVTAHASGARSTNVSSVVAASAGFGLWSGNGATRVVNNASLIAVGRWFEEA